MMDSPGSGNLLPALKQYFGHDRFLDKQEEVVSRLLAGEDLCVVMPTGAGKSVCYQLPALLKKGYTVVVSPLISLMKDQVDSLCAKKIPAAYINSFVSYPEQQDIQYRTLRGDIKLLYVAPERFQTVSFQRLLEDLPPEMLVVDEAHCISQWGHDFRTSYLRLGEYISRFGLRQVCAFTATATPRVQADIRTQLRRPEMAMMIAGFKRGNLEFSVRECRRKEDKLRELHDILAVPMPTIIYASTRKAVEEIAGEFDCIAYHAGMSDADRTEVQERFMTDENPVLAATNAFGMGIDRPDVRRVIHYNIPGSIEAYYQEAGRAGRDGKNAECILLFSYSDRFVQEFLIDMNNPPVEAVEEVYAYLRKLWKLQGTTEFELTMADIADNCDGVKNDAVAGSVMSILEKNGYIERGYRSGNQGKIRFIKNLKDLSDTHEQEKTQRSRFIHRMIEHYGESLSRWTSCTLTDLAQVAGLNVEQLRRVLRALTGTVLEWDAPFAGRTTCLTRPEEAELHIDFDALELKHQFELDRLNEVIAYTRERRCRQKFLIEYFGEDAGYWQCGLCELCQGIRPSFAAYGSTVRSMPSVRRAASPSRKKVREEKTQTAGSDDLFERLRMVRIKLAALRKVPAYMIFSDAALHELVRVQPVTVVEALRCKGIGQAKLPFLPTVLAEISEWRQENSAD
ncbi:MAG: ATP-dependent DNA helicase RecQ [Lentisphaeria bacterium]|nr:ATP-dependent DNA helicase RecQ [Lentisphaeria bacterium]